MEDELRAHAARAGIADRVVFHGFVDDTAKHELLAQSWIMALPSLKEGWGLVIGEAGSHVVPTVAYRSAGGTAESIDHKSSGVLAESHDDFTSALRELLDDQEWRAFLGRGALAKSHTFTWETSQQAFARVLKAAYLHLPAEGVELSTADSHPTSRVVPGP
ncbi:glycosyltransferase family 4 protein [Aeromicrobium sp. UC242_57]|uniref:glycosyltransferase family 4 protein n=1 Tax=Aeromicrobium sp. UC242_57 TaxID=3374624 RepID=UPI0037976EDC